MGMREQFQMIKSKIPFQMQTQLEMALCKHTF